jgi:ferredoxin
MKVSLNSALCQGHGRCYEIAPQIFTDDEAGHSVLERPDVDGDLAEVAAEAARACPELAITLQGESQAGQ